MATEALVESKKSKTSSGNSQTVQFVCYKVDDRTDCTIYGFRGLDGMSELQLVSKKSDKDIAKANAAKRKVELDKLDPKNIENPPPDVEQHAEEGAPVMNSTYDVTISYALVPEPTVEEAKEKEEAEKKKEMAKWDDLPKTTKK